MNHAIFFSAAIHFLCLFPVLLYSDAIQSSGSDRKTLSKEPSAADKIQGSVLEEAAAPSWEGQMSAQPPKLRLRPPPFLLARLRTFSHLPSEASSTRPPLSPPKKAAFAYVCPSPPPLHSSLVD